MVISRGVQSDPNSCLTLPISLDSVYSLLYPFLLSLAFDLLIVVLTSDMSKTASLE